MQVEAGRVAERRVAGQIHERLGVRHRVVGDSEQVDVARAGPGTPGGERAVQDHRTARRPEDPGDGPGQALGCIGHDPFYQTITAFARPGHSGRVLRSGRVGGLEEAPRAGPDREVGSHGEWRWKEATGFVRWGSGEGGDNAGMSLVSRFTEMVGVRHPIVLAPGR